MTRRHLVPTVAVLAVVFTAAISLSPNMMTPLMKDGIPLPFGSASTSLQGAITNVGSRNGIDVLDVTFNNGETSELLQPDKIYLVHVPNRIAIGDVPLDLAMTIPGTVNHNVDYYGYRYSDAAATSERNNISATLFKDRFPSKFFASSGALASDVTHGGGLAAFAQENDVFFRRTDNATGGVRIDPLGALYLIIVNQPEGATITLTGLTGCGNGTVEGAEACDDGNSLEGDSCSNLCAVTIPIPIPIGPGSSSSVSSSTASSSSSSGSGSSSSSSDSSASSSDSSFSFSSSVSSSYQAPPPVTGTCGDATCEEGEQYAEYLCGANTMCQNPQYCAIDCPLASSSSSVSSSSTSSSAPATFCGNGVLNSGEECDDGNTVDTDDCSNACLLNIPIPALP